MSENKIRYSLRFDKKFGYSATWKKGDEQKRINKLKEECLKGVKKTLEYLSKLPDDKLLEVLNIDEYPDD